MPTDTQLKIMRDLSILTEAEHAENTRRMDERNAQMDAERVLTDEELALEAWLDSLPEIVRLRPNVILGEN